ncbi:F14D16.7 [Arabidopsis thaliana]|uniref:F14D16.7 n=1 Tax=Arabidopsis thaliana TaxID=3702 RepID=Q9LMD5_ARATH|nr:F14D16.7 [Arabidopsis thaliana]
MSSRRMGLYFIQKFVQEKNWQTYSQILFNHAEILPIHEDSREKKTPTIMYEDNAACIAQLKDGYIKGDRTKHILPKFFYTHDLQKSGDVRVLQIRSNDNLADLFTKALPTATFKKLVYRIGLRRLKDLDEYTHKGEQHFKYFTSYDTIMVIRGSVMNKDGCPL